MQNGNSPFNTTSPYASLRDMFDGGGAGQMGAKFEGGGLLSLLANGFASPLGSQQGMGESLRPPPMPQSRPQMAPAYVPQSAAPPPVTASTPPPQQFDFLTMMQAMAAQRQQQAGASFAPFASAAMSQSPQQFPRWY